MHYLLRTDGDTPGQRAAATGVGAFIGCLPIYGAHRVLSVWLARKFGVSGITAYLAAHISNPITAPLLLYIELVVGHLLRSGELTALTLSQITHSSLSAIGLDLVIGSVVTGTMLALMAGGTAWVIATRKYSSSLAGRLREATSRRYLNAGTFQWEFVRGKLRHDPFHVGVLREGVLPEQGKLLDLGCGCGILPSLLATAEELWVENRWSNEWPPPPLDLELVGVELCESLVEVARQALGTRATIRRGDLATVELEAADAIVLADVLHYLTAEEQRGLLERASRALKQGGVLILRECDAAGGARFAMTRIQERVCAWCRGDWRQHFHYRSAEEWCELLESQGLATSTRPMWRGTPYSNVLLEARKLDTCSTNENAAPSM